MTTTAKVRFLPARLALGFALSAVSVPASAEETTPAAREATASDAAGALIAARENEALISGLRDVLARRDAFFAEADSLAENERSRRAADIAERFETLSARFPDSAAALYFFAEFLRDGGESVRAEKLLLRAEKLDADFVPVRFLLAEVLAARGAAAEAFPRFSAAVAADPGSAARHEAFGEFLVDSRDVLLEKKIFASRAELDAAAQGEFRAAAAVAPDGADFLWRYAESFYDVETPDWNRALAAWNQVARKIPPERKAETAPAVALHRARVLAELGRIDEADTLLRETAGVPALERSRRTVFEIIKRKRKRNDG